MPYKNKEKQLDYQKRWMAARRAEWLSDKCCSICGTAERLEVDHIDPALKISHNVWSWSEKRRADELAKCQVLCAKHHKLKTAFDHRAKMIHGSSWMYGIGCRCDQCKKFKREQYLRLKQEHGGILPWSRLGKQRAK